MELKSNIFPVVGHVSFMYKRFNVEEENWIAGIGVEPEVVDHVVAHAKYLFRLMLEQSLQLLDL